MLTDKQLSKNFLIRYYPAPEIRGFHQLVGVKRFKEIIGDGKVLTKVLSRVANSETDKVTVKLRRGIEFVFVNR